MQKFLPSLNKILTAYLIISVLFLSYAFYALNSKVDKLSESQGLSNEPLFNLPAKPADGCGADCQSKVQSMIDVAVASLSAKAKTAVSTPAPAPAPAPARTQTAYIPLAGPVTTTSTDWTDVPGTDTYIDLVGDYSKGAKATWDAFLSVANNNGQAYARLYDATHNIAINGSEISVTDKSTLTQVASGSLSLWAGRNKYRVQIKSLNSFVVTFGSGRVKITY